MSVDRVLQSLMDVRLTHSCRGFVKEVHNRKQNYVQGKWIADIWMGILYEDWEKDPGYHPQLPIISP